MHSGHILPASYLSCKAERCRLHALETKEHVLSMMRPSTSMWCSG